MNDYVCLIQKGQSAEQCREALAEGLKNIGMDSRLTAPAGFLKSVKIPIFIRISIYSKRGMEKTGKEKEWFSSLLY